MSWPLKMVEASKNEMLSYPILIGGCPRSGTTALQQLLNVDERVYISSEEDLTNSIKIISSLLSTRERREKKMQGFLRDLSVRESLSKESLHSHNFTSNSIWPVIRYIYKHHHAKIHPGNELLLWGDKYPLYYKSLAKKIDEGWVSYLHITRNPFDVVNSMIRRTKNARQGKDWWRAITEIDDMISAWSDAYTMIRKVDNRTNVLEVQYEELVFNTSGFICDFKKFKDFELRLGEVLVSDTNKHYERDFLTNDVTAKIMGSKSVQHYIRRFSNNKNFPFVAESLNAFY